MMLPRFTLLLSLSMLFILSSISISKGEEPAEVNMYVDGDIPSIQVSNWTNINLVIVDRTGINWTYFQKAFSWQVKYLWPVVHPEWRRFLGYTSLKVEAEVVEGDPNGWHLRFNRSTITGTTTSFKHRLQLQAMIDDSAIDYSVVVGIKCTRYDVYGAEMGSSYLYLPLKASPLSNIHMSISSVEKTAPPKSISTFTFSVVNKGDYEEMIGFNIKTDREDLIAILDTQTIVIDPKEAKQVTLRVLTPPILMDFGTPHKIEIYAYPINEKGEETLIGSVTVVTEGFYISPLIWIIGLPLVFLGIIGYLSLHWYIERRDQELYGKPIKPWLIPEEKEYLRELKKKDRKEYYKTLQMMKQEYQSALLWYKYS
ncbi:MAG TPA: hypothetical protein ENG62_01820, partial [Thermoplasmatales archaeon]|nr:hypothetical protein [Thermoplasmatales archaeon]